MSKDQETTRKYGYALLARGAGKRMGGSNKAALMHDGVTFLDRISSEMDKTRSAGKRQTDGYRRPLDGTP